MVPTTSEVNTDNTLANGGIYSDLRQVPVTTDLFYDGTNISYPTADHNYASVYVLENGGKITIEPCVRIFDCTFDLKTGSEIVFDNWPTNQINVARYNLLLNGGKVTKRDDHWLFQNNTEQRKILEYEAADFIYAGENVDQGQAQGDFIVDNGSEVIFTASNQIKLKDGFKAKQGSRFHAKISPINLPGCPPRMVGTKNIPSQTQNDYIDKHDLLVFPSVTSSNAIVRFKIINEGYYSIQVYNQLGELITSLIDDKILRKNNYNLHADFTTLKPGMYILKLAGPDLELTTRFIKEN